MRMLEGRKNPRFPMRDREVELSGRGGFNPTSTEVNKNTSQRRAHAMPPKVERRSVVRSGKSRRCCVERLKRDGGRGDLNMGGAKRIGWVDGDQGKAEDGRVKYSEKPSDRETTSEREQGGQEPSERKPRGPNTRSCVPTNNQSLDNGYDESTNRDNKRMAIAGADDPVMELGKRRTGKKGRVTSTMARDGEINVIHLRHG